MVTPFGQLVRGLLAYQGIAAVQAPPLHNLSLPTVCYAQVLARAKVCCWVFWGRDPCAMRCNWLPVPLSAKFDALVFPLWLASLSSMLSASP